MMTGMAIGAVGCCTPGLAFKSGFSTQNATAGSGGPETRPDADSRESCGSLSVHRHRAGSATFWACEQADGDRAGVE